LERLGWVGVIVIFWGWRWVMMFWEENDGCYYDRCRFPPYFPITKTDLKKGLNGIYPERRFKIQAISPKSVKIAP
jgi:hypothetical protein